MVSMGAPEITGGFLLARVTFRALNSNMDEEVRTTPADQTGAGVVTGRALGKRLRRAMVVGAIAGIAVGFLNVLAIEYRWKLAELFEILNFPFLSLTYASRDPFNPFYYEGNVNADAYGPGVMFGIICYWTFIGLFLGSFFCLVRAGVFIETVREKVCKYMLFFGVCAGMFIGSLSFLAASNGWEKLQWCFDALDGPIIWLMNILEIRFQYPAFLAAGSSSRFVCLHAVAVVYWAVIGLLVAWSFGVVRIVGKRIAAGKR